MVSPTGGTPTQTKVPAGPEGLPCPSRVLTKLAKVVGGSFVGRSGASSNQDGV
jgi:hypothetical protein